MVIIYFFTGTVSNKNTTLANFYAPNFDDVEHALCLFPDLNSYALIPGEDFNCSFDHLTIQT